MTRAQGWALALASVASFMVVLDLLVVATALSTIRRDLGASIGQLEWTVNAYTLAFAVLLMTAAAGADRFGGRRVRARRRRRCRLAPAAVDLPGVALGTGAALGLVWGLVRGSSAGWASPEVAGALAAGAVLTGAFVWWGLRARAPMLPMRLFAIRGFSAGNAVIFCMNASLTGAIFFMAQFLHAGLPPHPPGPGLPP